MIYPSLSYEIPNPPFIKIATRASINWTKHQVSTTWPPKILLLYRVSMAESNKPESKKLNQLILNIIHHCRRTSTKLRLTRRNAMVKPPFLSIFQLRIYISDGSLYKGKNHNYYLNPLSVVKIINLSNASLNKSKEFIPGFISMSSLWKRQLFQTLATIYKKTSSTKYCQKKKHSM